MAISFALGISLMIASVFSAAIGSEVATLSLLILSGVCIYEG